MNQTRFVQKICWDPGCEPHSPKSSPGDVRGTALSKGTGAQRAEDHGAETGLWPLLSLTPRGGKTWLDDLRPAQ